MYSLLNKIPGPDLANIKEKAQHIIENADEY
jgi:hypothetical protein